MGLRCEKPQDVRSTLRALLDTDGPAIAEMKVDRFEPPMPARVKPTQAAHLAKALMRGQPHRRRIALTLFRNKVHEL